MEGQSDEGTSGSQSKPCCSPPVDPRIARRFDERSGRWADVDELPEMVGVSARMLDQLRDAPLRRPSVLELGCGTGGLSVALLEMGASRVTGIDLSATSLSVARRRADGAGFATKSRFVHGNAVDAEASPHDWVVLDRVICCFGDVERLVGRAVELAGERIAISVPESRGWRGLVNRPTWAVEGAWDRLHGGFPGHVHDIRRIEAWLASSGFRPTKSITTPLWLVAIYDRAGAS